MMTKATFYISQSNADDVRMDLFCKIIAKAYAQKHQLYIYSSDVEALTALDEHLWIYNPNSFIAHDLILDEAQLSTSQGMIIFSNCSPKAYSAQFNDVLINFDRHTPEFALQFHRIIEVIDQHPQRLVEGRNRYKAYTERGIELESHKL